MQATLWEAVTALRHSTSGRGGLLPRDQDRTGLAAQRGGGGLGGDGLGPIASPFPGAHSSPPPPAAGRQESGQRALPRAAERCVPGPKNNSNAALQVAPGVDHYPCGTDKETEPRSRRHVRPRSQRLTGQSPDTCPWREYRLCVRACGQEGNNHPFKKHIENQRRKKAGPPRKEGTQIVAFFPRTAACVALTSASSHTMQVLRDKRGCHEAWTGLGAELCPASHCPVRGQRPGCSCSRAGPQPRGSSRGPGRHRRIPAKQRAGPGGLEPGYAGCIPEAPRRVLEPWVCTQSPRART